MRRIVLPLVVAVAAALAACSGGGSVLSSSSTADRVIVQNADLAAPGVYSVRQGSSLKLHAQGANGSQNGAVTTGYTWDVSYAASGTVTANTGGQQAACAALTTVPAPQPSPTVAPSAFAYVLPQSSIVVGPEDSAYATFTPPVLAAPAGRAFANSNYCAIVNAHSGGAVGSVTVLVTP